MERSRLFETGLFDKSDWQAQWVDPEPARIVDSLSNPSPMLRKEFSLSKKSLRRGFMPRVGA
ncbi:MAG: hypothetical protein HC817_14595 [Saprospiraceae bacterium]|nr:hypothetical protein [Saprospiraceae bacterium]